MEKKVIGIVDDEEDVISILSMVLRSNGYDVLVSSDGTRVNELVGKHPDLLLMDINMKGIKGTDICRFLKQNKNTSGLPIIMMSGNDDVAAQAGRCHAESFIEKPFHMDDLLSKIRFYTSAA